MSKTIKDSKEAKLLNAATRIEKGPRKPKMKPYDRKKERRYA